jgi:hypothetical protein
VVYLRKEDVPRIPDVDVADFRHRGKDRCERWTGKSSATFFFGNESNCERREAVPTVGITSYLSRSNAR